MKTEAQLKLEQAQKAHLFKCFRSDRSDGTWVGDFPSYLKMLGLENLGEQIEEEVEEEEIVEEVDTKLIKEFEEYRDSGGTMTLSEYKEKNKKDE